MTIRIPLIPATRAWFDPKTGKPTSEFARVIHDLVRRTGGQTTDAVADAVSTANTAQATAQANSAGVTVPSVGGTVTLTPASPLTVTTSGIVATIFVEAHTRSDAALPISAGSIGVGLRGATYYVWYADATDAGGAVTFVAQEDLSTFTASDRLVGTIHVPAASPTSGIEFGFIP